MTSQVKVHILFDFVDSASGGGNQFLKAVRDYLIQEGCYVSHYIDADVVLINSHHNLLQAIKIKSEFKHLKFIHRIDGPIVYYRDDGYHLDKLIFGFNRVLSNGTIFQSDYTKNESLNRGINLIHQKNTVILNAPDPFIFYKKEFNFVNKKTRLIATSWSGNVKKGFDVYSWLDKNLDFDRYEMIFVGNSPVGFENIVHKEAMPSDELAGELRLADIFIFASKVESCSNSLLEALHSGLPVIAFDSSSNPQLVKRAGEMFDFSHQIPKLIETIVGDYVAYQENISLPNINEVGKAYYDFISDAVASIDFEERTEASIKWSDYLRIKKYYMMWKFSQYSSRVTKIVKAKVQDSSITR